MSESSLGPCTGCGQKPATAQVTTIIHGKAETAKLCEDCLSKNQHPLVREHLEALLKATCAYCGAKAATSLQRMGATFGERFVCHSCAQELYDYFLKRLEALKLDENENADVQQIHALQDETDAHMRHWISRKLN